MLDLIKKHTMSRDRYEFVLLVAVLAVFGWSGWRPHDTFTWVLEVLPIVIGLGVLATTRRRFPLSRLLLALIALHMGILAIGGHYTYAEVPAFDWLRDQFGLARNHYDRVGHFAQGFVPALIAREVLLRVSPMQPGRLVGFLALCVAMAISAWYELLEWWVAAASGTAADAFLGTQGDPWDTQKDMFFACIGALCALTLMMRLHDRSLARLPD
jgi:putative membrane protein